MGYGGEKEVKKEEEKGKERKKYTQYIKEYIKMLECLEYIEYFSLIPAKPLAHTHIHMYRRTQTQKIKT